MGEPDLYYLRITNGSDRVPFNLLAGVPRCRYDGNPDFTHLYPLVKHWLVEVDRGRVLREVGVAELVGASGNGVPVVLGPFGRNPGVWTNLGLACSLRDGTDIAREGFEAAWDRLRRHLEPTNRLPMLDRSGVAHSAILTRRI